MGLKVGDSFFNRSGQPGVMIGRDQQTEALQIEREGPRFEKARTYGYINGLNPQERQEFEGIIDAMREKPKAIERVEWLQGQIDTMKIDPRRQVLTRYLEGELAHIMNSEGIYPRTYSVEESKV
jgi:hypothetical protein